MDLVIPCFITKHHQMDFAVRSRHLRMGFKHLLQCLVGLKLVAIGSMRPIDCSIGYNSSYAFFLGHSFFNFNIYMILIRLNLIKFVRSRLYHFTLDKMTRSNFNHFFN